MAQYQVGTVSVTNNTNVVTGVGTSWLTTVSVGDSFKVTGVNAIYGVIAVNSDTQIHISPNYAGTTVTAGTYQITTDFTPNLGLAEVHTGDSEFAYHLTNEVIRPLDVIVASKANTANPVFTTAITSPVAILTTSTGTAPLTVSSTTKVVNLNADLIDGFHASQTPGSNSVLVTDSNGNSNLNTTTTYGVAYQITNGTNVIGMTSCGSNAWGVAGWVNAGIIEANGAGGLALSAFNATGGVLFQTGASRLTRGTVSSAGNLIMGTTTDNGLAKIQSTNGITLGNSTNTNPTVLDWYEENDSLQATLAFGGASVGITYAYRTLMYTRIGREIHVTIFIQVSAKGTSTGLATITGLPYPAATWQSLNVGFYSGFNAAITTPPIAHLQAGNGAILVYKAGAGGASQMSDTDFTNGSMIVISGTMHI